MARWLVHAFCLVSLAVAFGSSSTAAQAKRIALVVGNSGYLRTTPLSNPRNDAADISATLRSLGFEVLDGFDLDKAAFDRRLREFASRLSRAEVGLFYFAGHGIQVAGQNYLLPVDAELLASDALEYETISLEHVQRVMERSARTNLIFVDACRNNPLARNLQRSFGARSAAIGQGLAQMVAGEGSLISFSTNPGNVALDGDGTRNSPYTAAMLRHLPGDRDLSNLLIAVRNDVRRDTQGRQVPWEQSSLTAPFFFRPDRATPTAPQTASPSAPAPSPALPPTIDAAGAWSLVRDTDDIALLEAFRRQYGISNAMFDRLAANRISDLQRKAATNAKSSIGSSAGDPETKSSSPDMQLLLACKRVAEQKCPGGFLQLPDVNCLTKAEDACLAAATKKATAPAPKQPASASSSSSILPYFDAKDRPYIERATACKELANQRCNLGMAGLVDVNCAIQVEDECKAGRQSASTPAAKPSSASTDPAASLQRTYDCMDRAKAACGTNPECVAAYLSRCDR